MVSVKTSKTPLGLLYSAFHVAEVGVRVMYVSVFWGVGSVLWERYCI